MNLYVFAAPYDYHRQAELVVMAEKVEDAKKIAEELRKEDSKDEYSYNRLFFEALELSDIEPEEKAWYMNRGCDC